MSDGACVELRGWTFTGTGYRTLGDAWLAESARARAQERRRIARQELLGSPQVGRATRQRKFGPGAAS